MSIRKKIKEYFLKKRLEKKMVIIRDGVNFEKTVFEGKNKIGKKSDVKKSYVGLGTYIGDESRLDHCKIGRYCSIGKEVKVASGKHPLNYVSTHHISFSDYLKKIGINPKLPQNIKCGKKESDSWDCASENYNVEIGNDVWVGEGVRILSGIKIGDGAVLGTGAVIVKDVEPYTIVGGVPGRVIRKRFDDETIKELLEIKFWDMDIDWLQENAEKLQDVKGFIQYYKENFKK